MAARKGPPKKPVGTTLDKTLPQAVETFWDDAAWYGSMTLLFGVTTSGKTTITEYMCACAITGHPRPGETRSRPPVQVVYMSAEDDEARTTSPRIRYIATELMRSMLGRPPTDDELQRTFRRFHFLESMKVGEEEDNGFSLDADLKMIEGYLAEIDLRNPDCPVALLVVSPISAYSGLKDSNDGGQARQMLKPLDKMLRRRFICAWLIGHPRKESGQFASSVADMHIGSSQYVNAVRVVLFTVECPDLEPDGSPSLWWLLLREKSNFTAKVPWGLRYQITPVSYNGMLVPARGGKPELAKINTTTVVWGPRDDRRPDDVLHQIREAKKAEQAADKDKGGKTEAAALQIYFALCDAAAGGKLPLSGVQMDRIRQDNDIADFSWRNGKKLLARLDRLTVKGTNNHAEWWLGDGVSPLANGGAPVDQRAPTSDVENVAAAVHAPTKDAPANGVADKPLHMDNTDPQQQAGPGFDGGSDWEPV